MKKQKRTVWVIFIILIIVVIIATTVNNVLVKKTQELNKNTEVMAGNFSILVNQGEYLIQNTDLKVKLISASVPTAETRDGQSLAVLKVIKNNKEKEIKFRMGGFAGYMETKAEVFGIVFELKDISKDKVIIHYGSK